MTAISPIVPPGRQTLECSVMDLADDIAYNNHDIDDGLRAGINRFRWVEYSFSATLMVVLISLYTGIDFSEVKGQEVA